MDCVKKFGQVRIGILDFIGCGETEGLDGTCHYTNLGS